LAISRSSVAICPNSASVGSATLDSLRIARLLLEPVPSGGRGSPPQLTFQFDPRPAWRLGPMPRGTTPQAAQRLSSQFHSSRVRLQEKAGAPNMVKIPDP